MPTVWFLLIVLCLLMYVVLDGYDLGIGIATLIERDPGYRHDMLEQVAQAWDGNETWLVLLGVSLWAGFPPAFATILSHAYLPMIVMLFALIVRGVSVEMASQAAPAPRWEKAFGLASLAAALAQGAAAGTLCVAGGGTGWFSVLSAITVACAYLTLGYAYTRWKATGDLRVRAGRRGVRIVALTAVLMLACLVAMEGTAAPLNLHHSARAIGFAALLLCATAGVATAVTALRSASARDDVPMVGVVTAAVAVILAVVVARYPVVVPPSMTVADAVAPHTTMTFLAVGIGVNMPLIGYYNWFAHHTFSGKITAAPADHDVADDRTGVTHDH